MVIKPLVWQRIVWVLLAAMTLSTLVVLFFIVGFINTIALVIARPRK
jgi:hypothetical protein